jgi:L-asparagine transporter-like permease
MMVVGEPVNAVEEVFVKTEFVATQIVMVFYAGTMDAVVNVVVPDYQTENVIQKARNVVMPRIVIMYIVEMMAVMEHAGVKLVLHVPHKVYVQMLEHLGGYIMYLTLKI